MNINEILLLGLNEPEYSRIEFWLKFQKESGFSERVFWMKLNESWEHYRKQIEFEIEKLKSWGNEISDVGFPLMHETGGKLTGHFGKQELEILQFSLFQYAIDLKLFKYYYEYDHSNIQTSKDSAPSRQYNVIKLLNEQRFVSELEKKRPNEVKDFLDFHLRCFMRNGGEEFDWLEHTRKLLPVGVDSIFKDVFLTWFEDKDGVPVKTVEFGQTNRELTPERELEMLFVHPGNIELYKIIKEHILNTIQFDNYTLKEGVTRDTAINAIVSEWLGKIIFEVAEAVYLFSDQPFKCINWAKGILKRYEASFAEFLQSIILMVLFDTKRFQKVTDNLNFVRQAIKDIDCSSLEKELSLECGMFEYFTGKDYFTDLKKVIEGFLSVRGLLQTESEIVGNFIANHKAEILSQFEKEIPQLENQGFRLPGSKNDSQTGMVSRTREFIQSELNDLDKIRGWEYAFNSEADYNEFVNLLTSYFEYKQYTLPT